MALCLSVCPSVCLSVCPFVTSRSSTKTAKRRITQTTPHDSPGTLVFWSQRYLRNSTGVTPYGGAKCRWGGSNSSTFDKSTPFSAFCTAIYSFVTGEPRDFKFGTLTYHSKSHPADTKILNRNVFIVDLKVDRVTQSSTVLDSEFQTAGAEQRNARSA